MAPAKLKALGGVKPAGEAADAEADGANATRAPDQFDTLPAESVARVRKTCWPVANRVASMSVENGAAVTVTVLPASTWKSIEAMALFPTALAAALTGLAVIVARSPGEVRNAAGAGPLFPESLWKNPPPHEPRRTSIRTDDER